jgi:hypothetical protein
MRYNRFFTSDIAIEVKTIPIEAPATTGNKFWVKISGVWKEAITWVNVMGTWKIATPFYKIGGIWK